MSELFPLRHARWDKPPSADVTATAWAALERGHVLFLPQLSFPIDARDAEIFTPAVLTSSKNASFDPVSKRIGGTTLAGEDLDRLRRLMIRWSDAAAALVDQLLPRYRGRIVRARSSFRPAEIAGRATSWRKDDTRLHVDSFPATPVQGRRILRVFTNVNPSGRPRQWRIGGEFEALAARFAGSLVDPVAGQCRAASRAPRHQVAALGLRRADAAAPRSDEGGRRVSGAQPQTAVEFPSGTTWVAFTDQVSHAAMAGQYQLEQTFVLPVEALADESRSPLRILERLKGRRLA